MSTTRRLHVQPPHVSALAQGIAAIRQELQLPHAFPADVEAMAAHAAVNPRLPDEDRTDLPFVTIDPPDAMDLDQALFVERNGDGYRVHYAIADVGAFVTPGDAIDIEANRRGQTLYGADSKIPLHPKVLSEDAASLLAGQERPALLWKIDLDATGEGVAVDVQRARVRSRAKLDYASVQTTIDTGQAEPMWDVLRSIGELRKQRERNRGGISLPLPEQEIDGTSAQPTLTFRARHPVEDWNEQISLLTGMAAAHLMLQAGIGLLRTLPKPEASAIARLHRTANALGIDWPAQTHYPDFIRSLDPALPSHIAMMVASTSVLRGAGYAAFNGAPPIPSTHGALASEYTHVTAPLRRLVDRYTGEISVAICAGRATPPWVFSALPGLPATMRASDRLAGKYERAVLDLVEAITLAPRIGEVFDGAIVEVKPDDPKQGVVMIREPAIDAPVSSASDLPLGGMVKVRLVEADQKSRRTRFEWVAAT